uniref:SWI6 n=1 Tax=Nakaseomyces delphensis TaxID=51657 RepID=Q874M6_NAKDE|nr:SWI6 [Nakaseomyces delphensis]
MIELKRRVSGVEVTLRVDTSGSLASDDFGMLLRWVEELQSGSEEVGGITEEKLDQWRSEDNSKLLEQNHVHVDGSGYVDKSAIKTVMETLHIWDAFKDDLETFKGVTDTTSSDTPEAGSRIIDTANGAATSTDQNNDAEETEQRQATESTIKEEQKDNENEDRMEEDGDGTIQQEEGEEEEEDKDIQVDDESSAVKKRNGFGDMGLNFDSQRELGSPLKKMKLKPTANPNSSLETLHEDETEEIRNISDLPIHIYTYDLEAEFTTKPIQLHSARTPSDNVDNDQKVKLETFLQRLLFPEAHESPSKSNSGSSNTNTFENTLYEIDLSLPQIPLNLNIPADEHGNTPLHWLTSIANIDLVKELVKHGASRMLGDNIGESALVKAVKSVNNYDAGTFEELLDYLYPCLIIKDSMDRSILHHIVITSGMSRCSVAAKYYLDILMGWIVKKQTRTLDGNPDPIFESLDLKWVISNLLNAQDSNGDTCLNIAARLGNVSIVDSLLDYGADPLISNKSGLKPVDFGAGTSKFKMQKNDRSTVSEKIAPSDAKSPSQLETIDTGSLVKELETLLNAVKANYDDELFQYKEKLGKLHSQLNNQREHLASSREQLAQTKQLRDEYALLKEQLMNIKQGISEEEETFRKESENLGFSSDEASKIDWNSSEFDADEPFRIDVIYDLVESKLNNTYKGNLEQLLNQESAESIKKALLSRFGNEEELRQKMTGLLPPITLLKARVEAYRQNDAHLDEFLNSIKEKRTALEQKFRKVLSLCLKIEEGKVDDMLDGLLQAISSEDPQEIDTEEMQDFLKKHGD